MPPDQIDEWEAEYWNRREDMEELKLAAQANAGLQDVKRGLKK